MKVFCIGHAVYDITLPLEKFPIENTKMRIDEKTECAGGSSSNCAVLLSRWGEKSYFIGTIGNDTYGRAIKKDFMMNDVDIRYLFVNKNVNTSSSYILVSKNNGKRTIITHVDDNLVSNLKLVRTKPDVIYLDGNECELSLRIIKKNKKAIKIIDAGKYTLDMVKLCHKVDYLVCSNNFAQDYTKKKLNYKDINSITEVYKDLEKDFNCNIIITLESYGSFAKINNEYKLIPSIEVEVKDSTGAGDIYHGAFTYFITHGYGLEQTMRLSNITGALSVTKLGSRNSIPKLEEVINYDK